MGEREGGYTLVVCEKPDAAMRIADALSGGTATGTTVAGVTVYRLVKGGEEYVVCAAQGHVYSLWDPFDERAVYPVFDAEWYGRGVTERGGQRLAARIAAIRELARGASNFVNACDYDVEGETIGFNVLRYACGGKEDEAKRAVFSALTKEELVKAFGSASTTQSRGLATAGRARHLVDFAWGVNLSRALSQSVSVSGRRYATISVGRVQGPTLGFVVERERQIRSHVPRPFWSVEGVFEKDGRSFSAPYSKERLAKKSDADAVKRECSGKDGVVTKIAERSFETPPPPAFNVGDLQRETYRLFRYSPSATIQIAERLYLAALVSYPRTGSQRLPASIDYGRIIRGLESTKEYSKLAGDVLRGQLRPVQGSKEDPAHPAIHPTGEKVRRRLTFQEAHVYDLIVKRFLSAFAPPARREGISVAISVGSNEFRLSGNRTVSPGWLRYFSPYGAIGEAELPNLREGDRLHLSNTDVREKFERKPPRYNQGTLLEKMEAEEIGTKATRAEIISTLIQRGYIAGEELTATDLGFAVVEAVKRYAPDIVTTALTRKVEEELVEIEEGSKGDKELIRGAVRSISDQLIGLYQNELEVGRAMDAAAASSSVRFEIGACPVCKTGRLAVIRSRKSGKRFVGCTNYAAGCRASAPLPQRGKLKAAARPCPHCSWPVVYVVTGRSPWRTCVNPRCPSKAGKKR